MAKHEPKPNPDFEPDYDTADVEYPEASQDGQDEAADPDYDEGAQAEYGDDFGDPDAQEASQEYYKRNQK